MSADEFRLERRAAQRFDFQLPVGVCFSGAAGEGCAVTQNLSGRGAFFYSDLPAAKGDGVELTLVMPAEISLTENMLVRCRGRVARVQPTGEKFGVAVQLEGYEFLPEGAVSRPAAGISASAAAGADAAAKIPSLGNPPAGNPPAAAAANASGSRT